MHVTASQFACKVIVEAVKECIRLAHIDAISCCRVQKYHIFSIPANILQEKSQKILQSERIYQARLFFHHIFHAFFFSHLIRCQLLQGTQIFRRSLCIAQ